MTASQAPAASSPRARLALAIGVGCVLAAYVVGVPLVLRGGAVSWRLALLIVIGGVAAAGLLALLWRLRRVLASAETERARQAAHVAQLMRDADAQAELARQQADRVRRQADQITRLDDEVTTLKHESASSREQQDRLLAESAALRDEYEKRLKEQSQATTEAVQYTLFERIPPAIEGKPAPPPPTGISKELADLLELAMTAASDGSDQQQSMRTAVVAMARRVQAAAHRIQEEATLMADRNPSNTDVLEASMRVDHAAAQQARTAQSMAVLLGEWPGQQWPDPLPLVEVVRAASGRIIAYRRIEIAGDPDIAASAPAVEPLIHLVAELLANATQSSPPTTQVPVTVRAVQRGAVIEVHDCGVGLDDYRLAQARAVATGEKQVGLEDLGEFPQTGLAVVGQYARRHGFRIDISESVYGGVRAIVGVPAELTETVEPAESASAPLPARVPAPTPASEERTAQPVTIGKPEFKLLPRRVSPRHGTGATESSGVASGSLTAPDLTAPDLTVPDMTIPDSAAPGQPTPEEAGAWMGAFLNAPKPDDEPPPAADGNGSTPEDNSTGRLER